MSDRYYRLCNVRDSAHRAGVLICYDPHLVFIAPGLTGEIGQISHGKGRARRRRAAQRPRVLEACQNEAAKGPRHQL